MVFDGEPALDGDDHGHDRGDGVGAGHHCHDHGDCGSGHGGSDDE